MTKDTEPAATTTTTAPRQPESFADTRARLQSDFEREFATDLAALEARLGHPIPRNHPQVDEAFRRGRLFSRDGIPGIPEAFESECRRLALGTSIETTAQRVARERALAEAEAARAKVARPDAERAAALAAWNEAYDAHAALKRERSAAAHGLEQLRARVAERPATISREIRGRFGQVDPLTAVQLIAAHQADVAAVPVFEAELAALDREISDRLADLREVSRKHSVPRQHWPAELQVDK